MVKTRTLAKTKQSTPKKKPKKPVKVKKIDENKVELCKNWLNEQKKDVFKIPSQPIDTLNSDSSSDETELIETRMNLYSVNKKNSFISILENKLNFHITSSK